MLVLYDMDETNFSTLGIGILRDFKTDPSTTEVLNGLYNLEFYYAKSGWLSEYLIEGNIIKADGQLFRIRNVDKTINDNKISILAKHIWFDLELNNWIVDVAPTNKQGHEALAWLISHSERPLNFNISGDCTKIASSRYVRMNPIEAIYNADNSILNRYGGELELNNFNITLHNRRGQDTGIEIRQRKNLTGATYKVDLSSLATRIMPVGNDGITLPEKFVDSPLINNYYAPFYKKIDVDVSVNEEENITLDDCYEIMRNAVLAEYVNGVDKPNVSINIDFVELSKTIEYEKYSNLESAHMGDSCKVYIPGLNINLTTRIVKIIKNISKNRIEKIELGTIIPNYITNNQNTTNNLKNAISQINPTSILAKAKESATNMINHPFGGYIYISEDTGEMYIMDTNDKSSAQSVWKFGLGGIGYSSTGINGTYETAITQDGKIVADFITTGKLNTNVIEGYGEIVTKVSDTEESLENINEIILNSQGDINDLKETMASLKSTLLEQTNESFTMWFEQTGLKKDVEAIGDILNGNGESLNKLTEYIHFEGAEMSLGRSDSQTRLVIKNDRISFMTGDTESAYISENTLYITDSTILNKLLIGHWETKEDKYLNLNTRWVGESNENN